MQSLSGFFPVIPWSSTWARKVQTSVS